MCGGEPEGIRHHAGRGDRRREAVESGRRRCRRLGRLAGAGRPRRLLDDGGPGPGRDGGSRLRHG
jgi:hypothetical protein